MPGTPYPKEQMHRIAYTKLSESQIADKLSEVAFSGPTSCFAAVRRFRRQINPNRNR